MSFRRNFLLLVYLLLWSSIALAEGGSCNRPEQPEIPDGSAANEARMVAAQSEVKAFLAAGNEYLACLDRMAAEYDGREDEEALSAKHFVMRVYNVMVDEMQGVGDRFNLAVRAYKANSK